MVVPSFGPSGASAKSGLIELLFLLTTALPTLGEKALELTVKHAIAAAIWVVVATMVYCYVGEDGTLFV